jgi:hypothetical protein
MLTLSTLRSDEMATRQEQYREAQRKRRERLKETGVRAITIELSAQAHARLRALSLEMFGDASQPSKVLDSLLTTSTTRPIQPEQEPEMTTSSPKPEIKPETTAKIPNRLAALAMLQAEWGQWPTMLGINPAEWIRARSNADRQAMAKKSIRSIWKKHHPDRGGDPDIFAAYQVAFDSVSTGKKSPEMPKKWAGWGVLRNT